jgi:hypothetical protein
VGLSALSARGLAGPARRKPVGPTAFALGTYINIERNAQGNWSVKVEKQPTDPKLLKSLIEKLLEVARRDPVS